METAAKKDSGADPQLARLREQIDQVNLSLLELLRERARLAMAIGEHKRARGGEVYQPRREQEIIEALKRRPLAPLRAEHIEVIFTEVISACRALERELRVSYLGPEHTYTHQAALSCFGASTSLMPENSTAAVFAAVEGGRADLGVVPVENSTEGSVTMTMDQLIDSQVQIVGEQLLPIRHALLSLSGDKGAVRRIVAHQQSLGQCRGYLAANFPDCELESAASNTLAAQRAATDPSYAAIASARAAGPYGLRIVADGIQDVAQNVTRFLVIGREGVGPSGTDKTTLVFAVPEKVGALREALGIFTRNSINLSMIQSRPQRGRLWEYLFFVDLKGHRDDPPMAQALAMLGRKALLLKVLGSYPEGRPVG